jgi:hypothetical protein
MWRWRCERWRPRRTVDAQEPMEGCWEANRRVTRSWLRHTAGSVQQPCMREHMRWALDAPRWRRKHGWKACPHRR